MASIAAIAASRAAAVDATWVTNADGAWSNGANWSTAPQHPDSAAYAVFVDSGRAVVNGDFSIGQLHWTGGVLSGPAAGTSLLTVDFDATISGPADKQFAATNLHFKGDVDWSAGAIRSFEPDGEGGQVTFSGGVNLSFDGDWTWVATKSPIVTIDADGAFIKSEGEGSSNIWPVFHNNGLVHVAAGQLNLDGGGTSSGTFLIDEGAVLQFGDFNLGFAAAGAETTTLDVASVIDADEGGSVRFGHTEFGDTRTDVYGKIDATAVEADPGATGLVLFHQGSKLGVTTPGAYTATSGVTVFDAMNPVVTDLILNAAEIVVLNLGNVSVHGALNVNEGGVVRLGEDMSRASLSFSGEEEHLLTGAGEVVLKNDSLLSAHQSLVIDAEMTVRAHGTIEGGNSGGRLLGLVSADSPGNFLVLRDFTIESGGVAEAIGGGKLLMLGAWDNNGTIKVGDGSTLLLRGTFDVTDIGVIQRTGANTVQLATTLQNAEQTFDLQTTTGTLLLLGGTIVGGRVQSSGAATLQVGPGFFVEPNRLDGVTLAANTTIGSQTTLEIRNGLTLDGATISATALFSFQKLSFDSAGPQTLGGTGEVVIAGNANVRVGQAGGTLTIGPGVTIRGSGSISRQDLAFGGSILNQGTLRADGVTTPLSLDGVTNAGGLIHATTGHTVSIARASADETMFVQTAGEMRTAAFGQIRTLAGLDIRSGKLTGNGTVFVSLDSTTPFVQVASGGAVAPGESIGTLTIDGKLILGDGGRLEIELDGATSDVLQVIQSNPLQVPAGDLDLSSANDFLDVKLLGAPMAGPYTIATYSGTLTGIFNHVTPGFSVTYDTAQKRLLLNALVRADFDADGDVDGRDFLIWQRGVGTTTGATRLTGDANFDGAVNAADLAVWRSQFGTSATPAGAPVPEPHSAVLILLGILPAARRGARAHGRASRARRRG